MNKSISCDSFFFNGKTKPLINSYGAFLNYARIHNIPLNRNIRKFAIMYYLNHKYGLLHNYR